MGASKYTRVGDFSDDEAAAKGGRSEQDSAQLDGELDAIQTVTDAHANDLDVLLRDDSKMQDDLLEGHEFSALAIAVLKGLIGNQNAALNWRGAWVTATDYVIGDLASEAGNTYYCMVDHTAGVHATDLSAGKWELFAQKGTNAGFPAGATASDVLAYVGGTEVWQKITALNAPLHALIANTNLTGTATIAALVASGLITLNGGLTLAAGQRFTPGLNTISFTTTPTFNFNIGIMSSITVTAAIGDVATSNRAAGRLTEIRFKADTVDRAIAWTGGASSWTFLGVKPTQLTANKDAILALRCYGTAETDVVAVWSEEI